MKIIARWLLRWLVPDYRARAADGWDGENYG